MGRSRAYGSLLGVFCGLAMATLSAAQDGPGLAMPGGLRPFADPLYWLNAGPPDRLPLHERPMGQRSPWAGAVPPRDRREGLVPSLGFALVHRRDSQAAQADDTFTALSFGADYRRTTALWQVQADYGVEITSAAAAGDGIDSHGGFLSLAYQPDRRNRLGLVVTHSSVEDLSGGDAVQRLAGATASRIRSTGLQASWTHDVDRRHGLQLGVSALRQATDAPGDPRARTFEASLQGWYFVSPTGRLDLRARVAQVDLSLPAPADDADAGFLALRMGYTADLGPRLAASGHVDLLATGSDGGRQFLGLGGSVEQSWRIARLSFGLERDLAAAPGLSSLVLTDAASARLQVRLQRGLLADLRLEQQRLEPLADGAVVTHVLALEGQISRAMGRDFHAWSRLRASRETAGGTYRDEMQVIFGLSRNLDF